MSQVDEAQNSSGVTVESPRPAPQCKWHWTDTSYRDGFRMPQEVETWHPGVAYPVNQTNGIHTVILWPYTSLYETKADALKAAINAQQQHIIDESERLSRLRAALAKVNVQARDAETNNAPKISPAS